MGRRVFTGQLSLLRFRKLLHQFQTSLFSVGAWHFRHALQRRYAALRRRRPARIMTSAQIATKDAATNCPAGVMKRFTSRRPACSGAASLLECSGLPTSTGLPAVALLSRVGPASSARLGREDEKPPTSLLLTVPSALGGPFSFSSRNRLNRAWACSSSRFNSSSREDCARADGAFPTVGRG